MTRAAPPHAVTPIAPPPQPSPLLAAAPAPPAPTPAHDYRLPSIPYLRLRFWLAAERPFRLPELPGSMLRGAFGNALRRAACTMGAAQVCVSCRLRADCLYTRLFENFREEAGPPHPLLRGLPNPPRPYLIEAPGGERALAAGESFPFDLVLLGRAAELSAYALFAVERLGGAGPTPARAPGGPSTRAAPSAPPAPSRLSTPFGRPIRRGRRRLRAPGPAASASPSSPPPASSPRGSSWPTPRRATSPSPSSGGPSRSPRSTPPKPPSTGPSALCSTTPPASASPPRASAGRPPNASATGRRRRSRSTASWARWSSKATSRRCCRSSNPDGCSTSARGRRSGWGGWSGRGLGRAGKGGIARRGMGSPSGGERAGGRGWQRGEALRRHRS